MYSRSIQQLFYNSTDYDREYITKLTRDFVDEKSLLYEEILRSSDPASHDHLKDLLLPLSTVHKAFEAVPASTKQPAAPATTIADELPATTEQSAAKPQSKVLVRNVASSPSRLRKVSADTSRVWPFVNLDVNLNSPLEAAFSVLMDTQEAIDYDPESNVVTS